MSVKIKGKRMLGKPVELRLVLSEDMYNKYLKKEPEMKRLVKRLEKAGFYPTNSVTTEETYHSRKFVILFTTTPDALSFTY